MTDTACAYCYYTCIIGSGNENIHEQEVKEAIESTTGIIVIMNTIYSVSLIV